MGHVATKFPEDDGVVWRSESFRRIGERGNVLLGQSRCRKCYEGRKEGEREETNFKILGRFIRTAEALAKALIFLWGFAFNK